MGAVHDERIEYHMRTTTRLAAVRAAAAAGALAVGLAGLGLGGVASAAETPKYGNIDANTQASLTVHKHVKSTDGKSARPIGDDTLTQAAVQGVVFTAYKLNVDLATPEGWDSLSAGVKANSRLSQDVCTSKTLQGLEVQDKTGKELPATGQDGAARLNLEQGAYLVCETKTADAVVNGKAVKITDKALPFIVTLPFPDAQGADASNGWVYNVHSFPKNTPVEKPVKKVVVDENKPGLGGADQVTYTIEAKIPDIDNNTENFKYFTIWDTLADGMSDIKVEDVEFADGSQFDQDKVVKNVNATTRFVNVNFNTPDGLVYLRDNPGKTVRVTIKAKIDSLPADGAGNIHNVGNLLVDTETAPHDPSDPPKTPTVPTPEDPFNPPSGDVPPTPKVPDNNIPTNKVVSSWGNLVVRKYDANDTAVGEANKAGLDGAEFKVVKGVRDDKAFPETCDGAKPDTAEITVNGVNRFTSQTVDSVKGIVTIPGLYVDSKHVADTDVETPDHNTRCYFLIETKAPVGYVLDDAPRPFVVTAGTTDKTAAGNFQIGNSKQSVPALPLTGASGQVLMMAGGAALVLLSAGTVLVARRREAQD